MLSNKIHYQRKSKILFDTNGEIELPINTIKSIKIYTCPLRTADVENYSFSEGKLMVNEPGRYSVEYE